MWAGRSSSRGKGRQHVARLRVDDPAHRVGLRAISADDVPRLAARDFETIVQLLEDGVVVLGHDGRLKFVNQAAKRILELEPEHLEEDLEARARWLRLYDASGTPLPDEVRDVAQWLQAGVTWSKTVYLADLPNGESRWLLLSGGPVHLDDCGGPDMLITFSDITEQQIAVQQLVHQANSDPLTGLPNRGYVRRRIIDALAATDGTRLRAVLFIDLDDLKTTNDTLGHEAGDALLNAAAARLRETVRSDDIVGRHGGDEFVALIFGTATRAEINNLVDRLRAAFAEPVDIVDTKAPILASVGLVEVQRNDPRSADEILRDADRAMYKAKRAGRGNGAGRRISS